MVLEPHQFNHNFFVYPKIDRRTKEGKSQYNDFMLEAEGKTLLSDEEMELVTKASVETAKNPTLVELMRDSYRELSCYTIDEKTGLKIKLRPDNLCKKQNTIVDLKTCLDSSYFGFRRTIENFQYHISAAYYCDFLNRENYVFCAIEKQEPYQTSLFCIDDDFMERGRKAYRLALDLMKWCYENNYFPDYVEFEILKECNELENLHNFFDIKERSEKILIIR
jgi:hypothetical protein